MVTTVNVKVYSDRTLSINKKVFGGMQTDIGSVEIVWDVSDVYNGNQYSVEIFGAAGTYSKSILLGVVYDEVNTSRSVTYEIPPELTEIGGQAVVYLIEEQIENEAVKRRICTYPLRLYLPHRSASSNEVKVEEYNRNVTDMYLAVVCAREAMETLNKDSANNLADAKAKLDKAILNYNRAIEVATAGINFGSGMKDFNIGDTYFGVEILKDNTYCVFVDGEYFAFDDNGAIKLSQEYLSSLSRRFDEKQFAFELNPEEALEFVEGENGKPVLRLKSSSEVYQDANGLHVDTGAGLKKDENGRVCADYTAHNVDEGSHNDIRLVIENLKTKVNTLLDSDDVTLDQMSEIVAYIKANKSLIDGVTTSKVNVADIIDNLTTNVSSKPLSAKQGVELKKLIDAIKVPTKLSEFVDDIGVDDKADKTYVDEGLENKADKEADYGVVYETTLTEETQSIVVDNLNLKKAIIYISVPEGTGTASLYVRINGLDMGSAKQVAFVNDAIKTTAQATKVNICKSNGVVTADWVACPTSSALGQVRGYALEKYDYETIDNIETIHLSSTSSTHIFPVGTTFKIKGVNA